MASDETSSEGGSELDNIFDVFNFTMSLSSTLRPAINFRLPKEEIFNNLTSDELYKGDSFESNVTNLLTNRSCTFDAREIDFSSFEYHYRKETWKKVGSEEIIKIVFYVIIFLVSLVGNILVILVVYYNSNMRTSTNQYLVNLAVADLLVTLCCTWVHLVRHLSHPNYVLPGIVCRMEGFIIATTLTASVLTLTVISVGRFLAVMFPLRARTSASHTNRVIILIWFLSIVIASPTAFYRDMYVIQWLDFTLWQCDEFWPIEGHFDANLRRCEITYNSKKNFYTIFTITLYFIPVTIMIMCYTLVVYQLWVTKLPGEHSQPARLTVSRSKRKVVKMVTFVLLAFVLCWTPLQSIILYSNFFHNGEELPHWFGKVEYAAYFVAHANSAFNPILYCSFNASFRQGLKSLLQCRGPARNRFHQRRHHWKGMTAGTRETTFGVSGNAEPAVLLEYASSRRRFLPKSSGGSICEGSPYLNHSRWTFRSNNTSSTPLRQGSNSRPASVLMRQASTQHPYCLEEVRENSLINHHENSLFNNLEGVDPMERNLSVRGRPKRSRIFRPRSKSCCADFLRIKRKRKSTLKNSEEVFRVNFTKPIRSNDEHMV